MRMLTIIGGVLMLLTGIFCFINPGQTFLAIAFVIGLVMALNGLIHICAYMMGRGLNNKGDNNGWILTDALITLLLGILVLCNQLVADTAIPLVFGMWVLVSGILRIEAATHINVERKRENFRITMITGVMTVVVGVSSRFQTDRIVILCHFQADSSRGSLSPGLSLMSRRFSFWTNRWGRWI